jgi:RNA polymerase sigma-70 factor (ECF subfamily)
VVAVESIVRFLAEFAVSQDAVSIDCSSEAVVHTLYKTMGSLLMAKAYSMVKRQDVAAEIVQDAFLKLWKFGGVLPSERAAYVWLYRTCQRQCIDLAKSAPHRFEHSDSEQLNCYSDDGNSSKQTIDRRQLVELLSQLDERDADIFVYVFMDAMTQQEVAELLGVARKTIQRSILKTQTKLQELAGNDER